MKLRRILMISLLVLLTGCSSEYNLKISNNNFKENISNSIPKNIIPTITQEELDAGVEFDDQITPFIEQDTASLITNNKFYKKKVVENNDYFKIYMSYNYNEEEFKKASSINNCFQYPELDFSKNYYINLQGSFYCLYSDSIDIKIETKNDVYYNNADEIQGNLYIWHIDESNRDYVDIKIEVDKGTPMKTIIIIIVSLLLVTLVTFVIYKIYKNKKEESSI